MPIVDMREMLHDAYRHGYAIGAFKVVSLECVSGILAAAERCHSPVILALTESHNNYFNLELLMPAVEAAAQRASIPVAIHLDQGTSITAVVKAINLGCNSVMVGAPHPSFDDNVSLTRNVVTTARNCGVPTEGELRYVAGTISEAETYLEHTGVDFLAVSIGTVHNRVLGRLELDYPRLQQINENLQIPLVLQGGMGFTDEQYQHLITNGIAKINYTTLADSAGERLRQQARHGEQGYADIMHGIVNKVMDEAEHCIRVWGSAGHAADILAQCTPWLPIEHLIIYNVSNMSDAEADAMMTEGRRVLSAIPGVRAVFAGTAIQDNARYRYTWLVRFCHRTVINSYRDHPDHVAFANGHFRPVAADRISIDYQTK